MRHLISAIALLFATACVAGVEVPTSQPENLEGTVPARLVDTATSPTATAVPAPASAAASTPAPVAARTPTIPAAPTPGPTAPGQAVADSAKGPRVPAPTPEPRFSGYRLEIQRGTFWEYRWVYTDRSCAQGRGCSTEEDRGLFRVTLASPRTVGGVTVYELNVEGRSTVNLSNARRDFAPRWRYLGIADDRIVVSNGSGLTTLFDAKTGKWAGSGYFTDRFNSSELVNARRGNVPDLGEILGWDAARIGPVEAVTRANKQDVCEMIAGVQVCPRQEAYSFTEGEYYLAGIGPLAYALRNSASFSGGGFSSSYQTTESVALVGSSLRGDPITVIEQPKTTSEASLAAHSQPSLDPAAAIFGPVDGALVLDPKSAQIPDYRGGLTLAEGVVDVTFLNPSIADGDWSYGVTFRHSEEETFHAVYLDGKGRWGHFARSGSFQSEKVIEAGTARFDLTTRGSNRLTVVFGKTRGDLFINGEKVASLDLSLLGAAPAGDVRVLTGLLATDDYSGAQTRFTGFTVYEGH